MLPLVLVAAAMSFGIQLGVDGTVTSSCEEARMKCGYRVGCGRALENYVLDCSAVFHANPPVTRCPEACQLALITLTSTDEGQQLMNNHLNHFNYGLLVHGGSYVLRFEISGHISTASSIIIPSRATENVDLNYYNDCDCKDEFCTNTKARLEVCRPGVERAHNDTVVSCVVAQGICAADSQCLTALEYYHRFCRSMFDGRKCSFRCKNSINILRRQQKAAKLDTCWCTGQEDYDCLRIRTNMAKLCYHKEPEPPPLPPLPGDVDSNELRPTRISGSVSSPASFGPSSSLSLSVASLLVRRMLVT